MICKLICKRTSMISLQLIKTMFSNRITTLVTTKIQITTFNKIKEQRKYKKTVKTIRTFSNTTMWKWVNRKMGVNLIKVPNLYFQYSIEKIPSAMIAAQDKILFWQELRTLQGNQLYQHLHRILNLQKIQIYKNITTLTLRQRY
jgi:hypothetical protein